MTNGSISHLGLKGVLCLSFAHSFLCHTGWMAYWISRSRFWETRIPLVNIFQHAEKKPMCFVRWKMATRWRRLTTFTMPLYLCKSAFLNDLRAKLLLQSAPILHLRFAELKIIGWPVFKQHFTWKFRTNLDLGFASEALPDDEGRLLPTEGRVPREVFLSRTICRFWFPMLSVPKVVRLILVSIKTKIWL